jgi:hypothetical protein
MPGVHEGDDGGAELGGLDVGGLEVGGLEVGGLELVGGALVVAVVVRGAVGVLLCVGVRLAVVEVDGAVCGALTCCLSGSDRRGLPDRNVSMNSFQARPGRSRPYSGAP